MITIITPAYNVIDSITKTYASVMSQKNVEFEYIIVDGMSIDNSIELYDSWSSNPKFKYFVEKDEGIYEAMNKGVKLASGDYIIFLGSGDKFVSDTVLEYVDVCAAKTHADIIYGYTIFSYKNGNKITYKRMIDGTYSFRADPVSHQALFAKRELLEEYPFDLKYKIAADQDWIMKMHKSGKKFHYIDMPISNYDMYGISASEVGREKGKNELYEIHKKYYPLQYIAHNLMRKIKGVLIN